MTGTSFIIIETVAGIPSADAWHAFRAGHAITQWNRASPEWHCPSAEVDPRVGLAHDMRVCWALEQATLR